MDKILFKENINGFVKSDSKKDVIVVQKNYSASMSVVSTCVSKMYDWLLDEYTVAIFRTKKKHQFNQ